MRITLTFPEAKVPAVIAAFNDLTPRMTEDDRDPGGKAETDAELAVRHLETYIRELEQNYRMRVATQQTQPDEDIVNVTDVTP